MRKLLVFMLLIAGPAFASSTRSQRVFDTMFVSVGGVGFPAFAADPWTCDTFTERSTYYNSTDKKVYYCNGTAWGTMGIGLVAGSGTLNSLVKFGAGPALSDSSIVDTGALISISNNVTINGNADEVQLWVAGNAAQTSNLAVFENSAGTDIVTVQNGGAAVLGSNLCLTNCNFATNDMTGWTSSDISKWSGATGKAVHTAGVADTLIQSVTVVSGSVYEISFAFVAGGTSTMTVALGTPVTLSATYATATYKVYLTAAATGAVDLKFTPAAAFSGSIDDVTVKLITSSVPSMTVLNSAGTVAAEVRGATGTGNVLIGDEAGGRITDATNVIAIGTNALASLGSGPNGSIAIGSGALDVFVGPAGSAHGVTGRNVAIGEDALGVCSTCRSNVVLGPLAGAGLTTGANNVLIGYNVSPTQTTQAGSVVIGSTVTNTGGTSVVIGDSAVNAAASAVVIGSGATTSTGSGGSSILIGANSSISATGNPAANTIIGANGAVAASVDYCIGLGGYANCTLDNVLVVGDDQANYQVLDAYFGEGVTSTSAVADKSFVAHATGGSGADNVGGNYTVAGGASTGTGIGGSVYTTTSPEAAGTASTLNALVTRSMVNAKTYAPADNTATTILTITVPDSLTCGGILQYQAWTVSASEIQSNVGQVSFGCIEDPDSATTTCTANESGVELATVSAGTYTAAWAFAGAALQVTLDSSLDTASKLTYVVTMNSGCVLTP